MTIKTKEEMKERETDAELIARHTRVEREVARAVQKMNNTKPGGAQDRKAWLAGCLNFTLLGIESEMSDRGL